MYINKIDELLDILIDDFYNKYMLNEKITAMLNDQNFVKYQLEINKILMEYIKNIDKKSIDEISDNPENIKTLTEIIKKYLAYYIFFTICASYKSKKEIFINNVIEFSKNQPSYNFKIDNFFNSDSNSEIIKYYDTIKNILTLVNSTEHSYNQIINNPKYSVAKEFLEEFGEMFVKENFKLENLEGNVSNQVHNITKVLIINNLYMKRDKKDIYDILLDVEKENNVYIYIDIVVPKTTYIDYNIIENMLSVKDVESGLASDIYDLITDTSSEFVEFNTDKKIKKIINSGLIIPIVDDFLLYHKDSEVYEKVASSDAKKKKEDTRIKYIVSKVDSVTEYYSTNIQTSKTLKEDITKLFYLPLSDRKAILINNNEELKIIKKIHNIGHQTIEANEYYNDLMNIRKYPYISFKDFRKYGFNYISSKTIDAVRAITFDNTERSANYQLLQMRVGSENQNLNIIGFVVPSNMNPIQCLTQKEVVDVRNVQFSRKNSQPVKYNNAYKGILRLLKSFTIKNRKHKESVKWIIDLEKDSVKLDKYIQMSKISQEQNIKIIIAKLYDDIVQSIYNGVINYINKHDSIAFHDLDKLLDKIDRKLFRFPRKSELYNSIENTLYEKKYNEIEQTYDNKDDIFYGLSGDIIKLPNAPNKEIDKIPTISLREIRDKIIEETERSEITESGAICQHFVTWDNMSAIRKKSPNLFSDILYEFINKYVTVNNQEEYICKSCGSQIDLKHYVMDGAYDDQGRFVTLSMPMEIPLEDVPEYEKYKPTIRYLDKLIEKIANICHMSYFLGNNINVKWRKRGIIKDAIDLLLIHNINLKESYKERNEKLSSQYGINKDITNLFVFELDNSIFIYSSKDKDHYKKIKQNNIMLYILFLMILELNESQMLFLGSDKICNSYLFDKYGFDSLFADIKIRTNNKGDVVPIKEYKTFCYILYFTSCMITKYNMWYTDVDDGNKTKKFNPITQKTIIYTILDLINSVIEIYGKSKKHRIYEIISIKTFNKLSSIFLGDEVFEKIKNVEQKKIVTDQNKKKFTEASDIIKISAGYTEGNYMGSFNYDTYKMPKLFIKKKKTIDASYFEVNNVTNCESGLFHKWAANGNTFKCSRCDKTTKDLNYDNGVSTKIQNMYKLYLLSNFAKKYCIDGQHHAFVYNAKARLNICTKCDYNETKTLSTNDLIKLEDNIQKDKKLVISANKKSLDNANKIVMSKKTKDNDFIKELISSYNKSSNNGVDTNYINLFMKKIEDIIGKDINIDNKNNFVQYNMYIIDHDNNGNFIDKTIMISEKDNKIISKNNHPFFKKDVIYYTNNDKKMDIYYDATTYQLLGYKEQGGEYNYPRYQNKHIRINYSLLNKLKFIGYPSRNIFIGDKIKEHKLYIHNPEDITRTVVNDICRNRIENLKKVIADIQRIVFKLKYKYEEKTEHIVDRESTYVDIIEKYKSTITKLETRNVTDKQKVFKNWEIIRYNLFFKEIKSETLNINIENDYVSVDDLNIYNSNGNAILYFIVQELVKLIDYNENKFIKTNIIYMIIDIINEEHNMFNIDKRTNNFEIKKFSYVLSSHSYMYEGDEIRGEHGNVLTGETDGFYEEQVDSTDNNKQTDKEKKNERDDAVEESKAMDMDVEIEIPDVDTEIDYEIDYLSGINVDVNQNPDVEY